MNLAFNKNEDELKLLISEMARRHAKIEKGGGEKKLQKQRDSGKLTARERISFLVDKKKPCLEIGAFAGDEMYEEYGGCPAGGVVVVLAYVQGRQCIVVANDASVKAGAWFPITGKKNLRAQQIALENHTPIIYLVDSAGVFLPLQDEIFPDREHFGRIFRNNAIMSGMNIPQISAIMGSCVAGGAYLPIMSDESLIVKGSGSIFLAGSYLVKAAIGEDIDNEALGGADTHCDISGVTDYKCEDDKQNAFSEAYYDIVTNWRDFNPDFAKFHGYENVEKGDEIRVFVDEEHTRTAAATVVENYPQENKIKLNYIIKKNTNKT